MINHQQTMTEFDKRRTKAQIHTVYVKDSDQQYRTIAYQLPAFLESHKDIRLVVIDSISAVYRGGVSEQRSAKFEKMSEICDIGTRLKQMASKHSVAVVVVNQVSDVPDGPSKLVENWLDFELISHVKRGTPSPLGIYIQSLTKRPVLGLSWSNSVTTRLRLARSPMTDGLATRRAFFVEFSPFVPRMGCEFTICNSGIHSVEDEF
ncbi:P-loop containing nucleoside triphosphate hydrolase protein [Backusella circina FSU 941]|nr:P-loop containing nucleoside triphosphate hydrolase protein [Backusella circina FSU 941]